MKSRFLPLLAVFCLVAANPAQKEDKASPDEIKGSWTVVAAERDGQPDDNAKSAKLTFASGKVHVKLPDKEHDGTYKLDATKKPKTIDIIPGDGPDKDQTMTGIYSVEGDTLKICMSRPGKDRPVKLETKANSGQMMMTLKRDKI